MGAAAARKCRPRGSTELAEVLAAAGRNPRLNDLEELSDDDLAERVRRLRRLAAATHDDDHDDDGM